MENPTNGRDAVALTPADVEKNDMLKARMSLSHVINDSHPLSAQDYELIGRFVQTYCFADLESRRVINHLTHIREGTPTEFALKLNDKDALDHLMACADCCTWNLDLAEGIRKAAEILTQHRHLRHMFAHWAGRRIPDHGALIFFTSSLGKQKIPTDAVIFEENDAPNMQYGLMPIASVFEELNKLEEHVKYLAAMAFQLETRAPQIAEQFAQDVADGKLVLEPYTIAGRRA
ncbi:hypothetical protein MKP15_14105 [Stenotrophomonas sp. Y6]|uniref:hypothetical protein n=1 Tax=Stenotrophomonas sp. Y6 TaxID=2920383 RepID=UPI001F0638B4|nr:hypothetical protein [Stenotrophomonas sp. Y6]MCH1909911.1 hypothetical protein [Stenotrophomonas sp. Y6]